MTAELLRDGKLNVERRCGKITFGQMFCEEALKSSTRRGNMPTSEKVDAMWKFKVKMQKPAIQRKS
jgi:hypothetical protein